MTFLRVLFRVTVLSLAAAAFVGVTMVYAASARYPVPNPHDQAARRSRPARPQAGEVSKILGEGLLFALYAATGRIAWRSLPRSSRGDDLLSLRRLQ